jgi:hypothetical protein
VQESPQKGIPVLKWGKHKKQFDPEEAGTGSREEPRTDEEKEKSG